MKTYEQIKSEVDAKSAGDWFYVLENLEKCADREHTVVHLPFSTSWIFTTGRECRWCMDPAPRNIKDAEVVERIAQALSGFDFCVLSHLHNDHYYLPVAKTMGRSRTLRWVVPDFMAERVISECELDPSLVTVVKPGDSFECKGVRLTAYPGYHSEEGAVKQVPETSFLAELPDGVRLAFPVDVRDYHQEIPRGMMGADWLFSHLWLGRKVSHLAEFPMLDEFCRFNLDFEPGHILVGHLNETGRGEDSMWTYRHWNLVRRRMHELSPKTSLYCPRNGSAFILTKHNPPDYFEDWEEADRQCFADSLGVSLRGDVREDLEKAIQQGVKAVEFRYDVFAAMEFQSLQAAVGKWREACGNCLSLHLADFSLEGDDPKLQWNVQHLGVDRVTEHVPRYTVEYMRENRRAVLGLFEERLKPMVDLGVVVGIENMHTKPGKPIDGQRRYGMTIEEWLEFVQELRDRLGESVGCHLDLGHAYTNYPFHQENTLEVWLEAGGRLINGIHLHQYETDRAPEAPHPDGHHPITGRNAGFPLLAPLYRHWQKGLRCPMFIEMRPRYQQAAFPSRQRLLDAWER